MNRLKEIFDARNIKVSAFARSNDIKPTTLYSVLNGQNKLSGLSISVFIKIAHGLGYTADELYEEVFGK